MYGVTEKLHALRLLVTLPERERQVVRRSQRLLVLYAEQASTLHAAFVLGFHGLGVLVLPTAARRGCKGPCKPTRQLREALTSHGAVARVYGAPRGTRGDSKTDF